MKHHRRTSGKSITSCLATLILLLFAHGMRAQTPAILWSFDTQDASFGQSAAGDIDGDGRLEIVFGCYRNDSTIYALNAEDGSLLWKHSTASPRGQGCNDVAPIILDIDADGEVEVIVPSSCNPVTYCFDGKTGAIRWKVPTRGSDSPPTAADIDGDGTLEILHGEFGGWVRCLNAEDGSLMWDLAVDTRSWIQTAPTILDADGDGELDFVVATWNRTEGDTNAIRAYRARDAELLWRHPLADVTYHGTAVTELDGDAGSELVIGDYSGVITVLNAEDGSVVWEMPPLGTAHYVGAPVSAGDLDGDGNCELVAVSWNKVFALSRNGSTLWDFTIESGGTAFRGAALADITGDALPDVVFGTSGGKLIGLHGTNGAQLWSVDLAADYGDARFELDHAPIIADLNGDGILDAFIVGGHAQYPEIENGFGRAYAVSLASGKGPEWLMFQRDSRRSSSLCGMNTTLVESLETEDVDGIALEIYPIPMQNLLYISGPAGTRYRIVDITGRTLSAGRLSERTISLDVANLMHGTYFLHAEYAGAFSVRTILKY